MKKSNLLTPLLFGSIAMIGLTGCEQLEQAANDAVEKAKQSAVQGLEEVMQSGSVDEAKQSASEALKEAKQGAAGLLEQASRYLSDDGQAQEVEGSAGEESPSAL